MSRWYWTNNYTTSQKFWIYLFWPTSWCAWTLIRFQNGEIWFRKSLWNRWAKGLIILILPGINHRGKVYLVGSHNIQSLAFLGQRWYRRCILPLCKPKKGFKIQKYLKISYSYWFDCGHSMNDEITDSKPDYKAEKTSTWWCDILLSKFA